MKLEVKTGQIIRHLGERKVVARVYRDNHGDLIIRFVDGTFSKNYENMEMDGRK